MFRKVALLVALVSLVAVTFGCASHMREYSYGKDERRVWIAGEQIRFIQNDVDRLLDVEEYGRTGRWDR
jgi:hypothetical protein